MNMKNNKLNGDDTTDTNSEEVCVETLRTHASDNGEGLKEEDIEQTGNANAKAEEDRYPPLGEEYDFEFMYRNKGL